MLPQSHQEAWRAHQRRVPISHELRFKPEGLVLGAGTVLVGAQGGRLLKSVKGQEARVLALLSAAHGRAVAPSVLANIERAAKSWRPACLRPASEQWQGGRICHCSPQNHKRSCHFQAALVWSSAERKTRKATVKRPFSKK